MTIPLTGTGGLFTRLGAIGGIIADSNAFQATNIPSDTDFITDNYSGQDLSLIDTVGTQQASGQSVMSGYLSYWQSVAVNTVNQMVYEDNPLISASDIVASLQEVIYQMQQNSQSLKQYLTTSNITPVLIQGNGVCVASVLTPDGLNAQMILNENITIACSQDQNTDPSLAGNETFSATGQVGTDSLNWLYPLGSGATVATSAINASADASFGTLLTNGDFESWTLIPNVPDNWEILVGTAGTTIVKGTNPYTGSYDLQFNGNGSELTALTQTFGTDNPSSLVYPGQWAVNCWVRVSATPAAGVLELSLIDENNAVINDQQGTPNTVTLDLTSVSTTYVPLNAIFRLPQLVPTTIKLRISLSTALSNGKDVYIDRIGFGPVTYLYQMGPSFAIFSGSENFYAGPNASTPGDYFTLTPSNSRPQNSFLWLMDRLFNLKQNNLIFPTSNTPTITELLIAENQNSLNPNSILIGQVLYGICTGPDNNLWMTDGAAGVTKYDPVTGVTVTYALAGTFVGICTGPDGNLWATDSANSKVWKITTGGSGTGYVLAASNPAGICTGPDSNLWVADQTGSVWKVTTAGTPTKHVLAGSTAPVDICVGTDNNLWVADVNHAIRVTTGGSFTIVNFGGGLAKWICSGPNGNIWLCDTQDQFFYEVNVLSLAIEYIDVGAFGMNGIVSGPDGNIWATTAAGLIKLPLVPNTAGFGEIAGEVLYDVGGPRGGGNNETFILYDMCVGPDNCLWVTDMFGYVWNIS
jgi:streptogramin lyase